MRHGRGTRLGLLGVLALATAGCGWELSGVGTDPGGANGGGGAAPPAPVQVDPAPGNGGGWAPAPGGGVDPGAGMQPSIEEPVPGQVNPVPVSVWKIEPTVDGRHVTVRLSWWSGPAPCSVLDAVAVVRDGTTITLTPLEGSDPAAGGGQVACPAIAMLRGTIVDLGELEPGTWTLAAHGDLAPVSITVN
ncbi:MAG TPA: hypothetical protein VFX65_06795 [Candidatus Limnocylindrales bacterium]|nr:hypothetical protein [Candidatus Limnocylindrales bacterium]